MIFFLEPHMSIYITSASKEVIVTEINNVGILQMSN